MLYRFGVVIGCGTLLGDVMTGCGTLLVVVICGRFCAFMFPFNSAISLLSSSFMPLIVCSKKDIS